MSQEKVKFTSPHPLLTVMREPQEVTRTVNGVMQIAKEDRPPFKFDGGEIKVTPEEAKELKEHDKYGTMFEEFKIPESVERVANKNKEESTPTKDEPLKDNEVKMTVVKSVSGFNEAVSYLKDNFGLEHSDVNSKDKILEQINRLALEFPNYPELYPED